jgi:hypothetical protein
MGFFIKTVPYESSGDLLRAFYDEDIQDAGIVSNTTRSFSLLPDTYQGWRDLVRSIRKHMRLRNYELTTFAAAMELGCTF